MKGAVHAHRCRSASLITNFARKILPEIGHESGAIKLQWALLK